MKEFHVYGETLSADNEIVLIEIVARARRLRDAYASVASRFPGVTVGGVRRGVDWALSTDPMQTFHLIGGGIECEDVLCALTEVGARIAMLREYPEVDIVEVHRLDDDA